MDPSTIKTIDDVIHALDTIIADTEKRNDPLGYFAALYRKVTLKVKEGIASGFFDDGERMEKLDVVFAKRYLDAYAAYRSGMPVTKAWQVTFDKDQSYWPIVLQHLLIGMNAHINLDLGIAAAEIMQGKEIDALQDDFNRINTILSDLVHEVEQDLSAIWPVLKRLLKWAKKVDDFMVDFSMKMARDGAWKFATFLAKTSLNEWENKIVERDNKVAGNARLVFPKNLIARAVLGVVRLGEHGTVSEKIRLLKS